MLGRYFNHIKCNKYLVTVWLFLTSASPFIFYSWPWHPHKKILLLLLCIMSLQLVRIRNVKLNVDFLTVCSTLLLYNIFLLIYWGDSAYVAIITQLLSLIVLMTYIRNFLSCEKFIKTFIYAVVGMAIGGTIIFWVHLFVGVPPLFSVNYAGNSNSYFLYLTCTNSYANLDHIRLLRYAGFFDESGAFSLCSLYAILFNRLYLRNNIIERILIICTMFSMSMAFFVSLAIYYLLFYVNKSNCKRIIPLLLIIVLSFAYINEHKNDNYTFKRLAKWTVERFESSEDGELKGNSRHEHIVADRKVFLENKFLGAGHRAVIGANLYGILGEYGVIGTFVYYIPLYLLFLRILKAPRCYRIEGLKIFFLLVVNLYHRPNITSVLSMVIIFCFCSYYTSLTYNKRQ